MENKTVLTRQRTAEQNNIGAYVSVAAMAVAGQSPRQTRQRAKKAAGATQSPLEASSELFSSNPNSVPPAIPIASPKHLASIEFLPRVITADAAGLNPPDLTLLHAKQDQLRRSRFQAWPESSAGKAKIRGAARATLVFAQEEAGTAVCISPSGLLLTCSHCVAESAEEMSHTKGKWLLFASGQIVYAACAAWDAKRDLALLRITAAQTELQAPKRDDLPDPDKRISASVTSFPFVSVAEASPRLRIALVCIGHPGSEDLEVSSAGVKTGYDVLHISTGLFRGYDPDQDLHDNSEIGALKHDCWTYWGHSGAPLVEKTTGRLIGLHSSWDETTGMRRGVPLQAIQQFLQQHEVELTYP